VVRHIGVSRREIGRRQIGDIDNVETHEDVGIGFWKLILGHKYTGPGTTCPGAQMSTEAVLNAAVLVVVVLIVSVAYVACIASVACVELVAYVA
jgi:hypothetical protein